MASENYTLRGLSSLESRLTAAFNDLMQRGAAISLLDENLSAIHHDLSLKGKNRPSWHERRFLRRQEKHLNQELSQAVADLQTHHDVTPSAFIDKANKLSREIRQVRLFQKQMRQDGAIRPMPDRYSRKESDNMNYTPQELANKKKLEKEERKRRKFRKKQPSTPLPQPSLNHGSNSSFNEAVEKLKQAIEKQRQDRTNNQKQVENQLSKSNHPRPLPQNARYKTKEQKLTPKQVPGRANTNQPASRQTNPLLRSSSLKQSSSSPPRSRNQPGHNPLLRNASATPSKPSPSKGQTNPLLRSGAGNTPAKANSPTRSSAPSQGQHSASGRSAGGGKSSGQSSSSGGSRR